MSSGATGDHSFDRVEKLVVAQQQWCGRGGRRWRVSLRKVSETARDHRGRRRAGRGGLSDRLSPFGGLVLLPCQRAALRLSMATTGNAPRRSNYEASRSGYHRSTSSHL